MEFIKGDARPGQVVGDTADEGWRHVDAHGGDLLGRRSVGGQVLGKAGDGRGVASRGHKHHLCVRRHRPRWSNNRGRAGRRRLGANAILRFDPKTEKFDSFPLPDRYAGVRQLAGRKGEVWGAESGADKLFVLKTE